MRHFLLCCVTLLCLSTFTFAREQRTIAVLVTLEGVSLQDFSQLQLPESQRLLVQSALGLMNNKVDGAPSLLSNTVTISAGTHARGEEVAELPLQPTVEYRNGYNTAEVVDGLTAAQLFNINTGVTVPHGAVVRPDIAYIRTLNATQNYAIIPGLLGQQLGEGHVDVSVYGNADHGGVRARNGMLLAMNREGWVPGGDVGQATNILDASRPYGVRTNYPYIFHEITNAKSRQAFIVVEAGDGSRVTAVRQLLSPTQYAQFQRQAIEECMLFVAQLNETCKRNGDRYLLIFAVLTPSPHAVVRDDLLTPILMNGSEIASGLLTSNTTRKNGLITNKDLAPTILNFFHIMPEKSMLGLPARSVAATNPLAILRKANRQMVATYTARLPVLVSFITCVALGGVLALVTIILNSKPVAPKRVPLLLSLLRPYLVALMLVPVSLMAAAGVGIYSTMPTVIFVAVTTLTVAIFLNVLLRDLRLILMVVGLLTSVCLCIDLCLGQPLLKHSILSYDPITGIRYYGLGNEACGVLIGATLLGWYALLDYASAMRSRLIILVAVVSVVVFMLIGSPSFGTKFGGMSAAIPGFGIALIKIRNDRAWRQMIFWCAGVAVVLLLLVLALNLTLRPDQQTHIGRAFHDALHGNPGILLDLAIRKWTMNLRLMRYSIWTYAFVSLLFSLLVLVFRPVGFVHRTLQKHPLLNAGFMGIAVGMVFGLLTNDSGISMAATGLLYLTVPLLLLSMAEVKSSLPATTPECIVGLVTGNNID